MRAAAVFLNALFDADREHWFPALVVVDEAQRRDPDAWAQAGSVTDALFLQRFAPKSGAWMHLDIFAWSSRGRPGWPMGAEAQAIRALYAVLKTRFG